MRDKEVKCPNCETLVPDYALVIAQPKGDDYDGVMHCGCYYTGGGHDSFEKDCEMGDHFFPDEHGRLIIPEDEL